VALRVILLANRRHLGRHRWVAVLAILGIALGVAMSTAIDLAVASSQQAFARSSAGVVGAATHEIVAGPSGMPDASFAQLRGAAAPWPMAPVVESLVGVAGHPGRALYLTGIDPLSETPFRPVLGSGDGGELSVIATLMTRRRSIIITAAMAQTLGVAAGDHLGLLIGTRIEPVVVAATIAAADGLSAQAFNDLALCDIGTAQELLGRQGTIDRIDLIVPEQDEARLASLPLPAGATLQSAGSRSAALSQMTRAFHLNLVAMGLLALVVGVFLIYNTIDFLVVQRREQLARLRLHGAQRRALFWAIIIEAAVLGLVGSVLGVVGGIGIAHLLVVEVTRTINDLYFVLEVREVALPLSVLLGNLVLGLVAAIAAAVIPAWQAMSTPPQAMLAVSGEGERALRLVPRLAALGLAIIGLAGLVLLWGGEGVVAGFTAIALVIGGWALVIPFQLGLVSRLAARPLGLVLGPLAVIATRSMRASLGRTGVAVAALAVAISASLGVGIMVDSFRRALVVWLDSTLRADIYVSAPRSVAARINEVALDPQLIITLSHVPGVASVFTKRDVHPMSALGRIDLTAFAMPPAATVAFTILAGEATTVWHDFDQGAILVTEPFASRHHEHVGEVLLLTTDRGPHGFTVAGIIRDYSSDQGSVLMAMATYHHWWQDRGLSAFSAYAAPGADVQDLVERMRQAAAPQLLQISSNRDLRRESLAVFDHTFAVTQVIRILAGSVAFLGVLSALLALILERRRELATLRMYGCTRGQIAAVLGGQALLTGLVAGVLAIPLGIVLAQMLVVVINRRSFGWSFALHVSFAGLVVTVGLAVLAAALAVVYPAIQSMRIPPASALRRE